MITVKDLATIAGIKNGNATTKQIADAFNKHAAKFGVNTSARISQFLANVAHETGNFTKLEESLNYSVAGLKKTFGRHRISAADCERLGRTPTRKADQKAIANILYGGPWGEKNLGNIKPNDGWDFRGSGPGQVTGRANYAKVQEETGIKVLENPDLMRDAEVGMIAALMLWQKWGLNEMADKGMTTAIRKRWNGGSLGLDEVTEAYGRGRLLPLTVPPYKPEPVVVAKPAPQVKSPPEPVLDATVADSRAKGVGAVLVGGAAVAAAAGGYISTKTHDLWVWISTFIQGLVS